MSTVYLHALAVVAPAAVADATRELFKQLEHGGEYALRTALSADGSAPATHFAANTVITESQRQVLLAIMGSGQVDLGVRYLITPNSEEGQVVGTNLDGYEPSANHDSFDLFRSLNLKLCNPGAS
jgi:hypothetical protein